MKTVDPAYGPEVVDRGQRWIGFSEWYNSGVYWPEITLVYVAALKKAGAGEKAEKALTVVENLIKEYQTLHEAYDSQSRPMEKKFLRGLIRYRSPVDFAMALGTYLWVKKK